MKGRAPQSSLAQFRRLSPDCRVMDGPHGQTGRPDQSLLSMWLNDSLP